MNQNTDYIIRIATLQDAKQIYDIYEPYILNTPITFEIEPVPLEIFKERMTKILSKFPWLVYEKDGKIFGYAYASSYRERAAFAWDAECSVYIAEENHHMGIATLLYKKLFELLKLQGYYHVYALINYPNESSVRLHEKFDFTEIGLLKNTGYKMGSWRDLIILEKELNSLPVEPSLPITYHKVKQLENILQSDNKSEN